MFKIAIKRAESQARLDSPEREQFGAKLNVQRSTFNVPKKLLPLVRGAVSLLTVGYVK